MTSTQPQTNKPRPLFVYGTLRAIPLLAWALTGDSSQVHLAEEITRPATVKGYARFSVRHADYPAVIPHDPTSSVDGNLLRLHTTSQRRKLDDFEGEAYTATSVIVHTTTEDGVEEMVEADMYVWAGDPDLIEQGSTWDLAVFIRDRLDDWIELFSGMELVG
ncbi:hypothetical protein CYLTODRAFT_394616 [Cylindrobasidium torrendii FP15055 ss-10]|uniref:Putative gamma-glutamylcyclotransferase n=1 Tax=Cylindrobasidium torrendii FP15055 ss-10 TaxID=1314674 RepID=A0A0D7BEF7_9AGAR|nr:hypothetical protein CYLTODRAFT_394616 [Cylindrobasidium torrendii FP15055 ss-10]